MLHPLRRGRHRRLRHRRPAAQLELRARGEAHRRVAQSPARRRPAQVPHRACAAGPDVAMDSARRGHDHRMGVGRRLRHQPCGAVGHLVPGWRRAERARVHPDDATGRPLSHEPWPRLVDIQPDEGDAECRRDGRRAVHH